MTEKIIKKKIKRLSKSARTFIRRTKQANRKENLLVEKKK
jgi:hypothetical protein